MVYQKMNYGNNNEALGAMHKPMTSKSEGITTAVNKHTSRVLNMKVIGLTGTAGSGKDTVANIIENLVTNKVHKYSFSTPVKEAASVITGLDPIYFDSNNPEREAIHPIWGLSPRKILQLLGTDCCRDIIHKDIWIKLAQVAYHTALHKYPQPKYFVITDVRFNNEAEWIKSLNGEVWNIIRSNKNIGDRGTESNHETERGIFPRYHDEIIDNNFSLISLEDTIGVMLKV